MAKKNVFEVTARPTKAVSDDDGWLFLKPLPFGNHIIHVKNLAIK